MLHLRLLGEGVHNGSHALLQHVPFLLCRIKNSNGKAMLQLSPRTFHSKKLSAFYSTLRESEIMFWKKIVSYYVVVVFKLLYPNADPPTCEKHKPINVNLQIRCRKEVAPFTCSYDSVKYAVLPFYLYPFPPKMETVNQCFRTSKILNDSLVHCNEPKFRQQAFMCIGST